MFLGKTLLEVKLERENERLKAELEYYKRFYEDKSSYSIMEEPRTISTRMNGDTVRLAILGGVDYDESKNSYHVYVVDRTQPEHFKIGYFISSFELLQARDRAYLMQQIIEKVARHIEKIL